MKYLVITVLVSVYFNNFSNIAYINSLQRDNIDIFFSFKETRVYDISVYPIIAY